MKKIYMDYAATTPVRKEVMKEMLPYFSDKFGNASSLHGFGVDAAKALEEARNAIAKSIGAQPEEIIFTSGGTEADNLAIKGVAKASRPKGNHIIISSIEHHAVLNACRSLEEAGYRITYLPVDKDGIVSVADIRGAITEKTILISVMYANNEIGTIQPIKDIGRVAQEKGIILHTDAVQVFGKMPIDVNDLKVDLMSISAHKIGGPKGVGVLYVRKGIPLSPQQHGGNQEGGKRAGTENVAGIVGLAAATKITLKEMKGENKRLRKLRNRLIEGVLTSMKGVRLNGHPEKRLANNVNFSFVGAEGEAIVLKLNELGIAASTGSACSSHDLRPSHVLLALGLDPVKAHGSLRLTLGDDTTQTDVDYVAKVVPKVVEKLREMAPKKVKEIEIEE